ncbi:cubilin-like isoform X2 [Ostrea edulis]|uniref:cubilin-like isoform X2 n=1 Tax=Ostrea edulis TaxID=37623 RepID=UPI0024AF67C6|nr:cubilin-like isoform X2 [Ostrea edulis]
MYFVICSQLFVLFLVYGWAEEVPVMQYISGNTGRFTSPGYPGTYPNNVNYTWILTTGDLTANVTFTFDNFDIYRYRYEPCTDDYLEITEQEPCCFVALKRCGDIGRFNMTVTGNVIRIKFVSNERDTAMGFSLQWKVALPKSKSTTETTKTTLVRRTTIVTLGTTRTIPVTTTPITTTTTLSTTTTHVTTKTAARTTTPVTTTASGKIETPVLTTPVTTIIQLTVSTTKTTPTATRTTKMDTSTTTGTDHDEISGFFTTFSRKGAGYVHLFLLTMNGIFIIVIAFLGMKLKKSKASIYRRRESPYLCANIIDVSLQERRQPYCTVNVIPLQEGVTLRNSNDCSDDYTEPDADYIEVIS